MSVERDYIRFLGTGGARFVVSQQLRSSAGTWCSFNGTNVCIDPGPGTLVRCFSGQLKLNPEHLDGIILTHRHLDHSTDANVMVEAMTRGTYRKRGVLYAPADALENAEPVVFKYLRESVERVEILKEGGSYDLGSVEFSCPVRHDHSVETYGLTFKYKGLKISFITDTSFFTELASYYKSDILIINVVLFKHPGYNRIKHLDIEGAGNIIKEIKPQKVVLTHFGTTMLDNNPPKLAEKLSKVTGVEVEAAEDDMVLELQKFFPKSR